MQLKSSLITITAILLVIMAFTDVFSDESHGVRFSEQQMKSAMQTGSLNREVTMTQARTLTLEQCIALSLENNPGLKVEQEKIAELENDYRAAQSGLFPKVSVSSYYNRVKKDRVGVPLALQYNEETLGQVKVRQLLYDGGKTSYSVEAASKTTEAQRESTETARLDTVLAVSQAYYQVLETREFIRVAESSRSRNEAFFKLTESLWKAGKVQKLESLRAEARLLESERTLVQVRETLRLSELILKETMGIAVEEQIEIYDGLPAEFPEPLDEQLLLKETFANNSDLKRISLIKEQSQIAIRSASGSYLPEISFQGSYGYRGRDFGPGTPGEDEWSAGIFLEWSLFDGGLTRAEVGKARARFRQAEANEKVVRDQVRLDLCRAIGDVRTAIASIQSSRREIDAQNEAYAQLVEFYKRGRATYVEVLSAETDLTQAKAAFVRSVGDYELASVKLDRVLGKR